MNGLFPKYVRLSATLVSLLCAMCCSQALQASSSEAPDQQIPERHVPLPPPNNVCGVNTLSMFLRAWGCDAPRQEINASTPRNEQGTSMLELQQAASKFGVHSRVYQCGIDDLGTKYLLPAICLLKAHASADPSKYSGHYGLLLKVDPEPDGDVVWLEGTLGARFTRSKKEFVDHYWRGYIMAVTPPRAVSAQMTWLTCLHAGFWLTVSCWIVTRRTKATATPLTADEVQPERETCITH